MERKLNEKKKKDYRQRDVIWYHTSFWYLRSCLTEMAPHCKISIPNNSCSRAVAVNLFEGNL